MKIHLKHIRTDRKKNAAGEIIEYHYHRHTGKRIHGQPGTIEFLKNYEEAGKKEEKTGTLRWLIHEYLNSPEFTSCAPRTRLDYKKQLNKIDSHFTSARTQKSLPLHYLDDPAIRTKALRLRDLVARTSPRQADYIWSVLRILANWAVDRGHITQNHFQRGGKLYTTTRADKVWTPETLKKLLMAANLPLKKIIITALHTGQRKGDILKLSRRQYQEGCLEIKQQKTGTTVYIPVTPSLKAILEHPDNGDFLFFQTVTGKNWASSHFTACFNQAKKRAGLQDLIFHDFRGTMLTELERCGCTDNEIMAISGHKNPNTILNTYIDRNTKRMAAQAMEKFKNSWLYPISITPICTETTVETTVEKEINPNTKPY